MEEERAVTSRAFSAYGLPLEMATYFKYLGRVISGAGDDWPTLVRNLEKARAVWQQLTRILIREGATPQVSEFFIKDVVQAVMIFGA